MLIVLIIVGVVIFIGILIFVPDIIRGQVIIGQDEVGIIEKKSNPLPSFSHHSLKPGQVIALNGEVGIQADTLGPGLHYGYPFWDYKIHKVPRTVIPVGKIGLVNARDGTAMPSKRKLGQTVACDNFQDARAFLENGGQMGRQLDILVAGTYQINRKLFEVTTADVYRVKPNHIGIVTTFDGAPIPADDIAGQTCEGHDLFQNGQAFIEAGGCQGLQEKILKTGDYNLNPWFVSVVQRPLVEIPAGTIGVVISNIGKVLEEEEDKKLARPGYKGILQKPLQPGRHAINTDVMNVILVPINPIALDWSDKDKPAYNYDAELRLLRLLSKDGFLFNIQVTQIIRIDGNNAPKMIAEIGVSAFQNTMSGNESERNQKYPSIRSLVTKVLEPTVGAYFRGSAQDVNALKFHDQRMARQLDAKDYIDNALENYGVKAIDTLINEIDLPDTLGEQLQIRAKTEQERETYVKQQLTEQERQRLERSKDEFDVQRAKQQAEIAKEKSQTEAEAIRLKHQAEAEAMRLKYQTETEAIHRRSQVEIEAIQAQIQALGRDSYVRIQEAAERAKIALPQTVFSSGGSDDLTQLLVARMMGISLGVQHLEAVEQKGQLSEDQIEVFVQALEDYLKDGGADKVRSMLLELTTAKPSLQPLEPSERSASKSAVGRGAWKMSPFW